jgi:hypothetical protein
MPPRPKSALRGKGARGRVVAGGPESVCRGNARGPPPGEVAYGPGVRFDRVDAVRSCFAFPRKRARAVGRAIVRGEEPCVGARGDRPPPERRRGARGPGPCVGVRAAGLERASARARAEVPGQPRRSGAPKQRVPARTNPPAPVFACESPTSGLTPAVPARASASGAPEPPRARFGMRESHFGVDGFGEAGGRGVEDVVFTRLLTPLVAAGRS